MTKFLPQGTSHDVPYVRLRDEHENMTSTVPIVEALIDIFTDLPRVSGKPIFEDMSLARKHLNQNCMNIQSYDGGGNHGHLGLVMT
jgi:hypothetical protein